MHPTCQIQIGMHFTMTLTEAASFDLVNCATYLFCGSSEPHQRICARKSHKTHAKGTRSRTGLVLINIVSLIARLCPSVRVSVHSRYLGPPGDARDALRRSRRPEPVWDV